MKEFVTINGATYECKNINTAPNHINFEIFGDFNEIEDACVSATEIHVSDNAEGNNPYGNYYGLKCISTGKNFRTYEIEDESENHEYTVSVAFAIPNETDVKIAELQAMVDTLTNDMDNRTSTLETSQDEQDETIAEILFGGEEDE